ncbi:hypothetical protein [Terracidiphilus sp.]|jgi:hypothetical protein|uniref:hypothetical protein n=1 Tax=Terracidiphilus sp. TaxID=1964191 RepID=UPI003C297551
MKKEILREAKYRFNFDRTLYVNQAAKKAFSLEFVEDHSEEELATRIKEGASDSGWIFYFNNAPSDGVKRELEKVLGA